MLVESRAVVIGCGALGTVITNTLVRMGVGSVVIADRYFIELDNLNRQLLSMRRIVGENSRRQVRCGPLTFQSL